MKPFAWLIGEPTELPHDLTAQYPELSRVSWRRGGLPLRIGGWLLGRSTVSGITLWQTIFLAHGVELDVELLLHEVRHVHQFEADPLFPFRYLWRSIRHGYTDNPYEADARAFARRRLAGGPPSA